MPKLSEQQQHQIKKRSSEVCAELEALFRAKLPPLAIHFDVRGMAWGYYKRKDKTCSIHFNSALCAEHFEETLSDVIPHELAHFAVDQMFRRRCKPHGQEWRKVMSALGIPNPSVTHGKNVAHLATRRQARHAYHCGCQQHWLSTTRHNRTQSGRQQYVCRRCGNPLLLDDRH